MSEPRYISPLLDGFSLGQSISDHHGVECYPAMRNDSDKRYIVKKISLPASQVQVEALLLTGVFRNADAVLAYYEELAQGVRAEVTTLNDLADQRGFVPCEECQIVPMEDGVGFEVYILSRYRKTLERFARRSPMTHLNAVNLGIDLCAAMAVCREAGWLYVDLKPENIYLFGDQEYRIGDLGFVALDSLQYASLPDRYRSAYTAPEVADAYASLNATMDTYALGLVLYEIYNGGKLPFDGPEDRQQWLERLASGERMEPPAYADEEMTSIIMKACALATEDRWQTPAEMGHALISYMQRNDVNDVPIVPDPEAAEEEPQEEEPAPAEPAAETTVEETPEETIEETPAVEEEPAESGEETPAVEEEAKTVPEEAPIEEEVPAEEEAPAEDAEEAGSADWIDLMDAFLAEEENSVEPVTEEGEPTLRELMTIDEEYVPDPEELDAEALSAETAEVLSIAQELIEHEAPAPVVVPEPVDVPIPEPIAPEPEEEDAPAEEASEPQEEPAPAEPEAPAEPAEKQPGILSKVLKTATALILAAGLAIGSWYYYQNIYLQTIDSMGLGGTATSVTVTVSTAMDESKLTVICKDTYGNAVKGTLENGVVTFTDLVPGTQYMISLEPQGFHKLTGSTSVTYSTPAETKLMQLSTVTGQEPGSVILSFGIEGPDSENWTLTYTAEGMEPQSVSFTGHSVTVNELTVGTAYTFTLTAPEGILLVGENTITHTAAELIQATDLNLADYADGVLTVTWNAPEGVDRWIVRCTDGAGYDQLQEVSGNTAAFEGVTEGTLYTVEVTAATQTLGIRAELLAKASSVSGFAAQLNGTMVELTWNSGNAASGWSIECSADGNVLQVLTCEENSAVFGPVAPGTAYTFTIQPNGTDASGAAPAVTLETAPAGTFSGNKLDSESIIVEMFDVPTKNNWGYSALKRAKARDTFKSGGSMALLYTVTKPYSYDDTAFQTVFVIRDSEGKLVSTSARSRAWDDMWDNGYCTETVSKLPAAKGSYTLSVYINNGLLAQLPFNIK